MHSHIFPVTYLQFSLYFADIARFYLMLTRKEHFEHALTE